MDWKSPNEDKRRRVVDVLKASLNQLVAQDTEDSDTKLQNIATQFEAKMWHEASSYEDYLGKITAKLAELKAQVETMKPKAPAAARAQPQPQSQQQQRPQLTPQQMQMHAQQQRMVQQLQQLPQQSRVQQDQLALQQKMAEERERQAIRLQMEREKAQLTDRQRQEWQQLQQQQQQEQQQQQQQQHLEHVHWLQAMTVQQQQQEQQQHQQEQQEQQQQQRQQQQQQQQQHQQQQQQIRQPLATHLPPTAFTREVADAKERKQQQLREQMTALHHPQQPGGGVGGVGGGGAPVAPAAAATGSFASRPMPPLGRQLTPESPFGRATQPPPQPLATATAAGVAAAMTAPVAAASPEPSMRELQRELQLAETDDEYWKIHAAMHSRHYRMVSELLEQFRLKSGADHQNVRALEKYDEILSEKRHHHGGVNGGVGQAGAGAGAGAGAAARKTRKDIETLKAIFVVLEKLQKKMISSSQGGGGSHGHGADAEAKAKTRGGSEEAAAAAAAVPEEARPLADAIGRLSWELQRDQQHELQTETAEEAEGAEGAEAHGGEGQTSVAAPPAKRARHGDRPEPAPPRGWTERAGAAAAWGAMAADEADPADAPSDASAGAAAADGAWPCWRLLPGAARAEVAELCRVHQFAVEARAESCAAPPVGLAEGRHYHLALWPPGARAAAVPALNVAMPTRCDAASAAASFGVDGCGEGSHPSWLDDAGAIAPTGGGGDASQHLTRAVRQLRAAVASAEEAEAPPPSLVALGLTWRRAVTEMLGGGVSLSA